MLIQGKWHAQGSAAQSSATLRLESDRFVIEIEGGLSFSGKLEDLQISDRLGNVERKLTLEDGSIFSTQDNKSIDRLFKDHKKINYFIHRLESHFAWVAIAIICIIVFSFSFFKWGVPWVSSKIAHALPDKANELIAGHTLDFLDDYIFDESQLEEQNKEKIRSRFRSRLIPLEEKNSIIKYKLLFRAWGDGEEGIPNAFALPSGDIILTDKFVELSESQDEIDAVILHEMGHVAHRHSLEMVIESTLVTTVVMMITGDNSGFVDMGLGVGSLLVSSNYSRGHESEADLYAFEHMLVAKIDPQAFSDIMNRITAYMGKVENTEEHEEEGGGLSSSLLDYLSSHPGTAERVDRAMWYSECFKKGLLVCNAVDEDNNKF
ncbi:MAG: M48 family metallopeptidase [Porticoccaceae bacterium]|nr:M48 family metallopeptidase [Porticoccaceae bacterium]